MYTLAVLETIGRGERGDAGGAGAAALFGLHVLLKCGPGLYSAAVRMQTTAEEVCMQHAEEAAAASPSLAVAAAAAAAAAAMRWQQ